MKKRGGRSILARLMALLLAVLVAQTGIYLLVFLKGGVVSETERNAFDILTERTANRKLYLENEMVGRWSNTEEGESDVLRAVRAELEASGAAQAMDTEFCQRVIARAAPDLIDMLRRNGVTGAFLVLDRPDGEGNYPGFYVRDYDPGSYAENNADLLLERGLPTVARETSVALDSYWSAFFRLDDPEAAETQFFYRPVRAAAAAPEASRSGRYFYYWSGPFSLSGMDREVVTYSVPLVWEDGTVLGVLGVDITTDYLADQLKYQELADERAGAYLLGVSQDGGETYTPVCSSGPNYKAWFGQAGSVEAAAASQKGIVALEGMGYELCAAVQPLKLYNTNTPFEGEQWALLGILESGRLLSFTRHIHTLLLVSAAASLLLGLVLVYLAARSVTRPVTALAGALRRSDPDKPIRLGRVDMAEVDALAEAVENLSAAAYESAARTSKIISMTHIPIGVFEYHRQSERVFCSGSLFAILDWPEGEEGDGWLPAAEFGARMEAVGRSLYDREELIFRLNQPGGGDHWLQLFYREEGDAVLGAFQDVTRDMEAKRKIEYERDFDILTDLYNRRAFDERLTRLFLPDKRGSVGVAALLMFDLDNLKYVNDTYGHDCGDRYIQAFARSLSYFYRCRSVVGRRSGDEFNVFLYGCGGKEEIRALVDGFWSAAGENCITLPDGKSIKVRASGGMAWYPDDADDFGELLRMADFAMYASKHTMKGAIRELDQREYAERRILIHGQDDLNRLIDGRLVRYAFQPVVSAEDGSVWGYELLMRPQVEGLTNLADLFRLAKAESKLYQMEKLTWFEALAAFEEKLRAGALAPGALAFINSIGGQRMDGEDVEALELRYGGLLSRVVVELTEGEELSPGFIAYKLETSRRWGALLALDDYGSGFNSDSVLLQTEPDLVKIDISIIRHVDRDPARLAVLNNIIGYCKQRGIRTLAEGVETREELETVLRAGVEYLQGFYLARPQFDPPAVPGAVVDEIRRIRSERARQ